MVREIKIHCNTNTSHSRIVNASPLTGIIEYTCPYSRWAANVIKESRKETTRMAMNMPKAVE
jgi:phage anti-repressor protein